MSNIERSDVRVVEATNQDLKQMVRDREFREDLYYQLNVFPIDLTPLRKRKADVPLLVESFVQQFASSMDKTIETIPESMRAMVLQTHRIRVLHGKGLIVASHVSGKN